MARTLILEALTCTETEDWVGKDDVVLRLVCDGTALPSLGRRMGEGETWTIRRLYTFSESFSVTLIEEDLLDPDDHLGSISLGASDVGRDREATFTRDDADYTLTYSVLDRGSAPVDPLSAEALTLWDTTLTMRLGMYRDLHLATEALRGTSLEVSVAEVIGRIRAALAEFASPRDVLEDVYWTVVHEPIADCLALVDEVTLALDLADVACDVVAAYLRMVQGVEVMLAVDGLAATRADDVSVLLAHYCSAADRSCYHGSPDPRRTHGSHDGAPTGGLASLIAVEQVAVAGLLARARGGEVLSAASVRCAVGSALEAIVAHLDGNGVAGLARRWWRRISARRGVSAETVAFVEPLLELLARVLEQERRRCDRLLASLEDAFVGNAATREVHRPSCPWVAQIAPGHRLVFESLAAAFAAGYDGCGHCLAVFHRR